MKIRTLMTATLALTLFASSAAMAQWEDDRDQNRHFEHHQPAPQAPAARHWAHGDHLPAKYHDKHYEVSDWKARHWKAPPRGYHYVRTDEGDVVLAAVATGVVADILLNQ